MKDSLLEQGFVENVLHVQTVVGGFHMNLLLRWSALAAEEQTKSFRSSVVVK